MAVLYDGNGNLIQVDAETTLANKKLVAFGTSITDFCKNFNGGYLEIVKNVCGLNSYENKGMSGRAMCNSTNGTGIYNAIVNANIADFDIITIESSTNDFKLNIPLGTVGTMGDTNLDTTTFCGAVRGAIESILTKKPGIQVALITDTQRDNDGYDVNYTNSAGHKLIDYVNAMIDIGRLYGVPVIDWYHLSGINALTFSRYTQDGLHPNALGYQALGYLTAGQLKAIYKVK